MNTMHENLRHPRVQPASDSSVELSNSVATVFLQIQRTSMTNMETQPMIKLISLTKPQDTPTKKKKKKKNKQVSHFIRWGRGRERGKVAALALFLAQTSVGLLQWHPRPTEPGLRLWRCVNMLTTSSLTTMPSLLSMLTSKRPITIVAMRSRINERLRERLNSPENLNGAKGK